MSMSISYEQTGRRRQKARTRAALLDAARELLAGGGTPNVEEAAEAAGVSRATAYRYFRNQRALLVAAHPEIEATGLLGEDAPADPLERLDRTIAELIRLTIDTEPELRTMLRLSLEPGPGRSCCSAKAAQLAGSRRRWPRCRDGSRHRYSAA
jgi:AcrR family transcriptional regulator